MTKCASFPVPPVSNITTRHLYELQQQVSVPIPVFYAGTPQTMYLMCEASKAPSVSNLF